LKVLVDVSSKLYGKDDLIPLAGIGGTAESIELALYSFGLAGDGSGNLSKTDPSLPHVESIITIEAARRRREGVERKTVL